MTCYKDLLKVLKPIEDKIWKQTLYLVYFSMRISKTVSGQMSKAGGLVSQKTLLISSMSEICTNLCWSVKL